MKACYHPAVEFSDEVFPFLQAKKAQAMWHMLLSGAEDAGLSVQFYDVQASEEAGSCRWEATYTLSLTGRKIHNRIQANFQFKDGKIIRHTDRFSFWKWSRMAFGWTGTMLGWTPFFKRRVREGTAHRLEKFIKNNPLYQ